MNKERYYYNNFIIYCDDKDIIFYNNYKISILTHYI